MTTLYLSLAEYRAAINSASTLADDVRDRMLDTIEELSTELEAMTSRRFDERYETREFIPASVQNGGDVDGRDLVLDDDLLSVSAVVDGLNGSIAADAYTLMPLNSRSYSIIRLVDTSLRWGLQTGGDDVFHTVTGKWGNPDSSWAARTTLSGAVNDSTTTIPVASAASLSPRMTVKVDTEYMLIESISGTNLTVQRAINGSTAAAHLSAAALYEFRVSPEVRHYMKRLAQFWNLQTKAPDGIVTVGTDTYQVSTGRLPNDLAASIKTLKRPSRVREL